MRTLKFIVKNQKLQKDKDCDFSKIIKGSKGYLRLFFSLPEEWKKLNIAVSFYRRGREIDAKILENGYCDVPDSVSNFNHFSISLTGAKKGYRITTEKITIDQEE